GLERARPGLGAAASAAPRDHRRGPRHRRAAHGRGAAAAGGRDDRGRSRAGRRHSPSGGGRGAVAAAAERAEGRLMSAPTAPTAPAAAARATRTVAVTVPDWPLLAALDRHQRRDEDAPALDLAAAPVLLLDQHRVTHAGTAALVLEADRARETALFELVAAAVDTIAAGVDVLRPGVLLMAARGPARHQGGEASLAERILDAVAELTGWDCAVGIADGPFA